MKIRNIKILFITIVLLSGIIFYRPTHVYALSISPIRVELKGNPGQVIMQDMTLTNDTKVNQIFYSSFANFEAQGETGNPEFVESKDDLDKWITADTSIALKPGDSVIVPIKISVPNNALPGGHFAAVFWGTNPNKPDNSNVSIGAKVGMLILLSVSGDVKEEAGLISFGTTDNKFWYNTLPVSFEYRFKNDGGDRIKPVGKVTIHDLVYFPTDSINANSSDGNILPGSTRRFYLDWIKTPRMKDYVTPLGMFAQFIDMVSYQWHNFAVGPYLAKIDLSYGTNNLHVSKNVFFFVFPWQLLICLVIIFIIVFWSGKKLIRRYNKYIIQKAHSDIKIIE